MKESTKIRNEKISEMLRNGATRAEVAKVFGVTHNVAAKVSRDAGVVCHRKTPEHLKREIVEYRKKHSLNQTMEKFGLSHRSIITYCNAAADSGNQNEKRAVRVLTKVPSTFKAPVRRW